jgi:hypothetical protein
MIAPAVLLALNLVQAPVACDWSMRPSGRFYICAAQENRSTAIAFICDDGAKGIKQIFLSILTGKQGISGRMRVTNAGKEVLVPMQGLRSGLNGFVSPAVPEAFEALTKLIETAKGPLSLTPVDTPDVPATSIDGAAISNALKTVRAACKGG